MARVNTYLNFQGEAEEALTFYANIFGTEVTTLSRYSDMPAAGPGQLPADEQRLVLHAELPIIAGHVLMATDMLTSMGQETRVGNNTTLCLEVETKDEADRLYGALSEGGRPRPLRHPLDGEPHPGSLTTLRHGAPAA